MEQLQPKMSFLSRSIMDSIPVKMGFITVNFWPYGQPISRPVTFSSDSRAVLIAFFSHDQIWINNNKMPEIR